MRAKTRHGGYRIIGSVSDFYIQDIFCAPSRQGSKSCSACSVFSAGVAVYVYVPYLVRVQMQIDLCGGDIGVAEHVLSALDVRAVLDQMRRERMAERVRCDIPCDPGGFCVSFEHLPETLSAHGMSGTVGE